MPRAVGVHRALDFRYQENSIAGAPSTNIPASTSTGLSGASNDGSPCPVGPPVPGVPACGNLTPHGGPIMHNVQFVLDFWVGCGSIGCMNCSTGFYDNPQIDKNATTPNDCNYIFLITNYFIDFCNDGPLLNLVNQYPDATGSMGSCSVFGNTSYYDPTPFPANSVSDSQIQSQASSIVSGLGIQPISGSVLPNIMVLVYTPSGEGSPFFPNPFCAYHNWFPFFVQGGLFWPVAYASIPDTGTAGGCGISKFNKASPTADPFADTSITASSHESIEAITDPIPPDNNGNPGGWFYYDTKHEIGDECSQDFFGINTQYDKSNVHLGYAGRPFTIQTEWSNQNNGCTLDLAGAPTPVQVTLNRDQNQFATASAPPGGFTVEFQEAGETSRTSDAINLGGSTTTTFFVTPSTDSLAVDDVLTPNEEWCLGWVFTSCVGTTVAPPVTGPSLVSYYYYDLVDQDPFLCFNPPSTFLNACNNNLAGSPPEIDLTYMVPPFYTSVSSGEGDLPYTTATVALSTNPQRIFSVAGAGAEVPACLPTSFSGGLQFCNSNGERWYAGFGVPCLSTFPYTCSETIPPLGPESLTYIPYWHQYLFTASYSISDGSSATAPSLTSKQLGAPFTTPLTTMPASFWLDADAYWSLTNPLANSGPTEAWVTNQASGVLAAAATVAPVYYHQYLVNFFYSVVGGGSLGTPSVTFTDFGSPMTMTPGFSHFVDAGGSYSYTNPLPGSSTAERWETPAPSGTIISSTIINPRFYNQFALVASYSISGGGTPAAPTLSSAQFGSSYTTPITNSPETYWLDFGSSWSTSPNPLAGSTLTERWQTLASPLSGTVTGVILVNPLYYHQFFVAVSFFVSDASAAPSNPTLTSSSFGSPISQTLLTTPAGLWLDSGTSWSATTVLSGSTLTERWFASTSFGTVTSAPIMVEYFHQYFVTFGIVVVGQACSSCGGTTAPSTGWQNAGSNITITATPNAVSAFVSWTTSRGLITIGDSGSATTTALINGPGTITVRFRPLHG